jgi:hypothetical protein
LSIALLASQVSCAKRAARNKPTDRLTSAYLVTAADGRLLFMTTENVVVSDSKGGTVGFDRLRSLDAKTGNAVAFHMFGDSGSKGRYACAPGQNGAIWCSRGSNPVRLERRSADTLEVVADPAAIEQSDPQLASGIAEVYVDLVHSEILVVNGQGDSLVLEGAGPKVTLRSEHRGNDHFFDNFGKFRYPGDTAAETPAGQLSFAGKDGHYELLLQPKDESERRVVRTLRVEAPLFVHDRDSRRHVEHDGGLPDRESSQRQACIFGARSDRKGAMVVLRG